MKPLRWTMLASHVPPDGGLGGIVRYTTEMLTALADRPDVDITAVTTEAAADAVGEAMSGRGRVVTVPSAPTAMLSIGERWWSGRFTGPVADVIHGVKHLLPRRTDAFRLLTVHDMLLLDRPQDFGTAKRLLLPTIYRGSIRDADLLECVSTATRDRLESHVPAAKDRAEVVRLATSSTLSGSTSRPLDALRGKQFALVVGDPTPRKNLRTVIAAWAQVREQVPDAVLAVAGPPSWGRTEVGPLWDSLVASGAVVALGYVADDELRWAYERADVVLCPSLAEGFGLPAAEALDLGAPVVISDDAAMQEVCAGRALAVLPAHAVSEWADATVSALRTSTTNVATLSPRTWGEVADETVSAVRRRRAAG